MSTEPAQRDLSLTEKLITGAVVAVILAAFVICTGLAEVAHYGDWDCFAKRCVVVPDGKDGH